MNVTICLIRQLCFLEEHAHFFDDAIDAKLLTNPKSAADHFNKIRNDIDEWWLKVMFKNSKSLVLNFTFVKDLTIIFSKFGNKDNHFTSE